VRGFANGAMLIASAVGWSVARKGPACVGAVARKLRRGSSLSGSWSLARAVDRGDQVTPLIAVRPLIASSGAWGWECSPNCD
jgi:hypothetical protein